MIRTLTATAMVAASLAVAAPVAAGGFTVPHDPPPGPGRLATPEPGRQPSTTCGGAIGCAVLRAACGLADGTYSEWHSSDHGHPHGICTWPSE